MAGTEDIVDATVVLSLPDATVTLDLPDSASFSVYEAGDVIWDAEGNPILDSDESPIHED